MALNERELAQVKRMFSIRLRENLTPFLRCFYTVVNNGKGGYEFYFKNKTYTVPQLVMSTIPEKLQKKMGPGDWEVALSKCNVATCQIRTRERLQGHPFVSLPTGPKIEGSERRLKEKGFDKKIHNLRIDMDNAEKRIKHLDSLYKEIKNKDLELIKHSKKKDSILEIGFSQPPFK